MIYACGHSKNGILLAPATGMAISALAMGQPAPFDLTPFGVDRFSNE
jgi:glycine/D-amino acid oxidase-like deaminating enzyme